MIDFIDINGTRHGAITEYSMRHGVNGEKSLSGTVYTNEEVIHGIDRGWRLEIDNEFYVVTFAVPVDNGSQTQLEFDAVHEFFYDMSKSSVYTTLNGSNTAKRYLDFIFDGTGYEYRLEIDVPAFEKENFGMENRLALFNDFVRSTGVEFVVNNRVVRILREVGTDLSTIVKKGFNMQELRLEKNINEFITYKRGFGAWVDDEDHSLGRLEAVYESPLSEIYGRLEGDPIVDERYTVKSNLEARLQNEVEESYSISVQLIMEDLTKAGYQYKQPRTGDYIMAMNEELGFEQRIRIVSYESHYDVEGNLIDHDVTCNSLGVTQTNSGSAGIRNAAKRALENSERALAQSNYAVISADGKTTNYYGETDPRNLGYEVRFRDTWYQVIGEEKVMNVWNGAEWEPVIDTRDLNRVERAIEAHQKDIQDARSTADEAVNRINGEIADKFTSLDDNLLAIQSISTRADANALAALDNALSASTTAESAMTLATDLSGQVSDFELTVNGFNQTVNNYTDQVAQFTSDVNGLNSTVASYETQLDEFGNTVSTYATQVSQFENTVSGLNSTVSNYQSDVQGYTAEVSTLTNTVSGFNATVQRVEADYSDLSGTVQSLGASIGVVEGQITNRVWQTDIQSAVDGIEVGGRNLIRRNNEITGFILSSGGIQSNSLLRTSIHSIDVEPNTEYVLSGNAYELWRFAWEDESGNLVLHQGVETRPNIPYRIITSPSNAKKLRVSYPNGTHMKLEKGNKATDWTPAPEDTMQLISNVETEWRQTAQGFEQSITRVETDLNGKVSLVAFNTLESTVDTTRQRIGDAEGNITRIEANVSGLQTTVASKASQTEVTHLADGFNVLSKSVVKNLVPLTSDGYVDWSRFVMGEDIGNASISGGELTVRMNIHGEPGSGNRIMLSSSLFETPGKFNIRIRIRGAHGTSANQQIAIGQNGHWSELINISNTDRWYELVYEAPSPTLTLGIAFVRGTISPTWFTISGLEIVPTGAVSESQLSVLSDAINARVVEGDVMSQINIEAGRTLIDTDRLYLSANTTVFGGSAFIPNAAIQSLSADKLTAGTIDAATVNLINLNASSIVSGTLSGANMHLNLNEGVFTTTSQVANQLAGMMTINYGRLESVSNVGTGRFVTLSGDQLHFGDNDGYIELTPRYIDFNNSNRTARLRFNGTNLVVDQHLGMNGNHINSVNWIRMIGGYETVIHKHPTDIGGALVDSQKLTIGLGFRDNFTNIASFYGRIDFMQNLHMNGNNIQSVSRVALDGSNTHFLSHHAQAGGAIVDSTRFTIGIGSITSGFNDRVTVTNSQIDLRAHTNLRGFRLDQVARMELDGTNGYYMHLSSGSALVDSRMVTIATGNLTSVDRVADFYGRIDFYKNLNMNGNVINNQSDARLKTNIVEHEQSSLEKINGFNFVDFTWIKNGREDFGLIAQEVQQVAPELISEDSQGILSINNTLLNMMTTHAIQELSERETNTNLLASAALIKAETNEEKIKRLENEVEELKRMVA